MNDYQIRVLVWLYKRVNTRLLDTSDSLAEIKDKHKEKNLIVTSEEVGNQGFSTNIQTKSENTNYRRKHPTEITI